MYTNLDTTHHTMTLDPAEFDVRYAGTGKWGITSDAINVSIAPGDTLSGTLIYRSHQDRFGGDISIDVRDFGGIQNASWFGPNPMTD